MKINVTGTFKVHLNPVDVSFTHTTSLHGGRMNIDKTFEGSIDGHSNGEMISILNSGKNAGGYVAVEVFEGQVEGMTGSFALQHYGKFDASGQSLTLEVVPGSGEGELAQIFGSMKTRIEEGAHYYDFEGEV